MGLGKTVQAIALLSHLVEISNNKHILIIVPLSTLYNWEREFKTFAPKLPFVLLYGTAEERVPLKSKILKSIKLDGNDIYPIVITTYNTIMKEENFLRKIHWYYMIVDEAQRLKNHTSLLSQ